MLGYTMISMYIGKKIKKLKPLPTFNKAKTKSVERGVFIVHLHPLLLQYFSQLSKNEII